MTVERGDRGLALGLVVVAALSIAIEYQIGDFLYDSQTASLTPVARVLLIVGTSCLLVLLSLIFLQRFMRRRVDEADPNRPRPQSRTFSVLPLIRGILLIIVAIVGALAGLSEAGIDIGPMLAGAGVVGIALGLGAQSLLRDILAGVFFVAEDSFRVGEYVEIGQLRGTVERISLRSMKVRHHRGALHTIPYGQIPSISNYSRDWVIVKFEIQVPHDTDVLKLKKVVKEVSAEIAEVPGFKPFILEPLKSQGMDSVDLFGITVRLKFKAVPGEQFTMRREMLRRLTNAFEAAGIKLAKRSVHVETATSRAPSGAAAEADDDQQLASSTPAPGP